jgi:hypothetical protein
MAQFSDEVLHRLDQARKRLAEVTTRRADLQIEESRLSERIKALEFLLKDEGKIPSKPNEGIGVVAAAPQSMAPQTAPVPIIQFVSDIIEAHMNEGVTNKEIIETLKESGYQFHRNYPYVAIAKLKEQGKIIESGGKLIWKAA